MGATETFRAARDLLLENRDDYDGAVTSFRWPELSHFNFGFDWFDVAAAAARERLAQRLHGAHLELERHAHRTLALCAHRGQTPTQKERRQVDEWGEGGGAQEIRIRTST